jgi:hypothetical protein
MKSCPLAMPFLLTTLQLERMSAMIALQKKGRKMNEKEEKLREREYLKRVS